MATLNQINKEWCEAFTLQLTNNNAAIVFALGVDKRGRLLPCVTTDISKEQFVDALTTLLNTVNDIEWPNKVVSSHPFLHSVQIVKKGGE